MLSEQHPDKFELPRGLADNTDPMRVQVDGRLGGRYDRQVPLPGTQRHVQRKCATAPLAAACTSR